MNPSLAFGVIAAYFFVLFLISFITSRGATSNTFFTGNHQSPWYIVAFGMIGASLSGVTFISVPGEVGNSQFSYFQVVLGYLPGYLVIATVLMPLYYRLKLISIYTYLEDRFGFYAYKTGAAFFLLSRIIGASFRLWLVATVLQLAFFGPLGVPFWVAVLVTIALIWLYTFRGGIKTVVWTDTLQTFFMILAVVVSIYLIGQELELSFGALVASVSESDMSKMFFWDVNSGQNFFKQFISGAFIAIVMTGLDQDMMQKNLTCKNIKEAQLNMFWFCVVMVIVNLLFLSLGALLYQFADARAIPLPDTSDKLYPILALNHFNVFAAVMFLLGVTAAAYSSADSALTALTTSFSVDFLNYRENENGFEKKRIRVHLSFSILLFLVILVFNIINDRSVIAAVFIAAGYTYGPILGLFSFGLLTKYKVRDQLVPVIGILSPILSYVINSYSEVWFNGFQFGFMIVLLNGALTFLGLFLIREPSESPTRA